MSSLDSGRYVLFDCLKSIIVAIVLFHVVPTTVAAQATNATPPIPISNNASVSESNPSSAHLKTPLAADKRPLWLELSAEQRKMLEPLAAEWNQLEPTRKKKWLEIASKFEKMKPDEQLRVQQQMRVWAKLTPEQRRAARESYVKSKKLLPTQKTEKWRRYQQLSQEQKKKLATETEVKRHVANLPPSQTKSKVVRPIKSMPKPLLEQSINTPLAEQLITPAIPTQANPTH